MWLVDLTIWEGKKSEFRNYNILCYKERKMFVLFTWPKLVNLILCMSFLWVSGTPKHEDEFEDRGMKLIIFVIIITLIWLLTWVCYNCNEHHIIENAWLLMCSFLYDIATVWNFGNKFVDRRMVLNLQHFILSFCLQNTDLLYFVFLETD